jgi:glutathione synthase
LPDAVNGDKRILLFDGESVGAVLRVPGKNEARGNLHVGGRAVKSTLDDDDRAIIAAITPTLRAHGQLLVGIDVIGGRMTEINITSPTGVRHIEELDGRNVAGEILDRLERRAQRPTT